MPREVKLQRYFRRPMNVLAGTLFCALIAGVLGATGAAPAHAAGNTTAWGWPQPYEQISPASIAWLKQKGWWPISVAWQTPWSGENTINVTMDRMQFLEKRGLEAKFIAFGNGPSVNESFIAGRTQVGSDGNFPFTTLIDKNVPVTDLATLTPNIEHCVIVPNDSKIKSLKDFAGSNPPAAIGIVTGSSAEFYFREAAHANGVTVGKDVTLVNMPIPDQLPLPKGVAAVVPWEPSCSVITDQFKTGRVIDTIYKYNMYQGNFFVRSELTKNVPDVVQAITDAYVETTLYIRAKPQEAAKFLSEDPALKQFPFDLLLKQTMTYNNLYKPTYVYPFAKFWSEENVGIADFLYGGQRISRKLTAADYFSVYDESFMNNAFKKLGWKIPAQPPFIPANWAGKVGHPPYPTYDTAESLKSAQAWPQKGDLVR